MGPRCSLLDQIPLNQRWINFSWPLWINFSWPKSVAEITTELYVQISRFGTINDSNRIFCCCGIMDIINQGTELPVD